MPALLRSASLTGYAELAREARLNPTALLSEVGLPLSALREPDLKISAEAVRALLELSAQRSGVEAFGLRLAESRRLSNLGAIGLLLREAPTLRRALEEFPRFVHLHNTALFLKVEEAGGVVVIRQELAVGRAVSMRQSTELAIGVMFRMLTVFLGLHWRPQSVCFAHSAPKNRAVHWRIFGRRVEFGHDFSGIVCDARDLDVPNPGADPVMAHYARRLLEASLRETRESTANDVRQLVFLLLPAGRCGIDLIAQHLGVTRRTAHRQLAREGETFSSIVDGARRELAARYVEDGGRPLAEVSALLGFSAPSAFSRWYRQGFGESAAQRRSLLK